MFVMKIDYLGYEKILCYFRRKKFKSLFFFFFAFDFLTTNVVEYANFITFRRVNMFFFYHTTQKKRLQFAAKKEEKKTFLLLF